MVGQPGMDGLTGPPGVGEKGSPGEVGPTGIAVGSHVDMVNYSLIINLFFQLFFFLILCSS